MSHQKKEIFSGLNRFLNAATPHGLFYLQSGYGIFARIFWIIFIIFGFVVTISMMRSLLKEWEAHPIITTIESAALPVSNIPFPTVTVCPDNAEIDNFALVQKITNLLKFQCLDSVSRFTPTYPYCNETLALREDFKPFFEFLVKTFEEVIKHLKISSGYLNFRCFVFRHGTNPRYQRIQLS